jgi:hypothetical protein
MQARKVVMLGFSQQVGQVLGEAIQYGFTAANAASNLQL